MKRVIIIFAVLVTAAIAVAQPSDSGLRLNGTLIRHHKVRLNGEKGKGLIKIRVIWLNLSYSNLGDRPLFIPRKNLITEVAFFNSGASREYVLPSLYLGQTGWRPRTAPDLALFQETALRLKPGDTFTFNEPLALCVASGYSSEDRPCGGYYETGSEKELEELLARELIAVRFRTLGYDRYFPGVLERIAEQLRADGILLLDSNHEFVAESEPIANRIGMIGTEPEMEY